MKRILPILIAFLSSQCVAAVDKCEGLVDSNVLTVEIEGGVINAPNMYSISISAENEWQGHKITGIGLESIGVKDLTMSLRTNKGDPKYGHGQNDINKSYALFLASDKWLTGEYCVLAYYTENGKPNLYYAAQVLILKPNKALKDAP